MAEMPFFRAFFMISNKGEKEENLRFIVILQYYN